MSLDQSLERFARNQVLFREVNERMSEVRSVWREDGEAEFLCECSNLDCTATLSLARKEYAAVRWHPNLFVIEPGHELPEAERIVRQNDRYVLVEKTVEADYAVRMAPRPPDARR